MFDGAIIPADVYGDGDARPPRIIAPLQHLFDPVVGATDFYGHGWWGDSRVSAGGFSDAPRIVFDRLPVLPANLAEAMLYHLQVRLIGGTVFFRCPGVPAFTFAPAALDGEVTLLQ